MIEYSDNELVNLVCENNEDASDALYKKYGYIVDIIINKYRTIGMTLKVDFSELKQEAMLGFSNALVSFDQDKDISLATFITLCVERKVHNYLRNLKTQKNFTYQKSFSLDDTYGALDGIPLIEKISDETFNPESKLEEKENVKRLVDNINDILSPAEKEVYNLLINDFSYEDIASILKKNIKDIYNAVHRIKQKVKLIVN